MTHHPPTICGTWRSSKFAEPRGDHHATFVVVGAVAAKEALIDQAGDSSEHESNAQLGAISATAEELSLVGGVRAAARSALLAICFGQEQDHENSAIC